MFPGKRAAIMLNPLSLPTAPYIVGNRFLSPSVLPTRLESDVAYVPKIWRNLCTCTPWRSSLLPSSILRGWPQCRGRSLFHDKLFLRGGILDRGLRLVPEAWSMISRNSRTPALRLLFSTLSMDTAHMSRT